VGIAMGIAITIEAQGLMMSSHQNIFILFTKSNPAYEQLSNSRLSQQL